jgi:adenine-specific DNA methylase
MGVEEKKERKFILIAPLLASMRSLVGTFGVYIYFIKEGRK